MVKFALQEIAQSKLQTNRNIIPKKAPLAKPTKGGVSKCKPSKESVETISLEKVSKRT